VDLADTWVRVLDLKYLFLSKDCHVPSVFIRLTIHLANKHLFCRYKSKMPRPERKYAEYILFFLILKKYALIQNIRMTRVNHVVVVATLKAAKSNVKSFMFFFYVMCVI